MVRDIVAYQGFITRSLSGFEYMRDSSLKPYSRKYDPVVVFGGDYKDSVEIIKNHRGTVIIRWMGADSRRVKDKSLYVRPNIINVTPLLNVRKMLLSKGINCHLIRLTTNKGATPLIKGNKIYTYIHHLDEPKYNAEMVRGLKTPYEIMVMRLKFSKKDWYAGECDKFYKQCFIGLALSSFAGGGQSIVEMGLRGIRVVTNVLNLPHCIPWKDVKDIEVAIEKESGKIGTSDLALAKKVESEMVLNEKGFNLKSLLT